MYLLGRGVLGPAPLLRFGARYKKSRSAYYVPSANQASKSKGGKAIVQRDAMGRPIVKQREKSLGTFKPLATGALTQELFETESPGRMELAVPPMRPRLLAPGVATRFHDMDPTSPMRVYGVPKHMLLEFRLMGAPCSITTSTTLSLIRTLEEAKDVPARLVLNGRSGVGKSFLLLQAAQYAAATREWIVLYIPRARHFVDASTSYQYSLATRTYLQPRAAYQTLSRLSRANSHLLSELSTQSEVVLPDGGRTFPEGTPLTTLIDAGLGTTTDAAAGTAPSVEALLRAPFVLDAVLSEIGQQEHFPVLIAIDDFQSLCGRSLYKDPRFKTIRPHHLSMPRLLLEYAGGHRKLARGLVLTALTRSDTQFPVTPQLSDALHLGNEFSPSPRSVRYRKSKQLAAYLEGEVEEYTDPFAYLDGEDADADPGSELADSELVDSELASSALADSELSDSEFSDSEMELAQSALDADSDAEAVGASPWTGWTAYNLPTYEDSVSPTAVNPFPIPKPTEEWRTMVLPREEDDEANDAVELGGLYDRQDDVELGEDAPGAEGGQDGVAVGQAGVDKEDGKKKKKKKKGTDSQSIAEQPRTRIVRALRAIRVPDALSVREAAGLFEMWLDAGVLRTGGQRRATRRLQIDLQQAYSVAKAEADADPETAYDTALDDLVESDDASSSAPPPLPSHTPQPKPAGFSAIAAASLTKTATTSVPAAPVDEGRQLATLRAELAGKDFDELRTLDQDAEVQAWAHRRAVEDARLVSLDELEGWETAAREEEPRNDEALEEEADWAAQGVSVGETSADDSLIRAAEALAGRGERVDTDLEETETETYTPLELGDDPQIARIVSAGVRSALADPETVGDLLRADVSDAAVVEDDSDMEDEENDDEGAEDDELELGEAEGEEGVEEDTGADELFLSKYQESSGNARTFVKGLMGTLQTSG
ncbi:mitochondrial ribosomal death-associated protein 3-domain-containing protein [Mycena galopus ATCC 62051]|nr:mitochondrial ribosomal death-associated protein 3-domain-containing protein [Mycena galopus ATCC 62051]